MASYVHGSTGSAYVGATQICLTGWDVDIASELADVTSTCSGGFHEYLAGLKGLTATINANWDLDASPVDDPPNFTAGATLTNVKLNISSSSYWLIPTAIVESFKATVDVNDVIKYTVSIKANGSFSYPS